MDDTLLLRISKTPQIIRHVQLQARPVAASAARALELWCLVTICLGIFRVSLKASSHFLAVTRHTLHDNYMIQPPSFDPES